MSKPTRPPPDRPCKRGHRDWVWRRVEGRYRCLACKKSTEASWRAANQESHKAQITAWLVANPERVKTAGAARYAANREHRKAQAASWRAANPKRKRASDARRYTERVIGPADLSVPQWSPKGKK